MTAIQLQYLNQKIFAIYCEQVNVPTVVSNDYAPVSLIFSIPTTFLKVPVE
jgi:hypothetical protein